MKISLMRTEDRVLIMQDGISIGKVSFRSNSFHQKNTYINFDLQEFNGIDAATLFKSLSDMFDMPLQAMIASSDQWMSDFLLSGGFVLKRRCYEMHATYTDYRGDYSAASVLLSACRGEAAYDACAEMLYHYYRDTHDAVNPLTASLGEFKAILPEQVFYSDDENVKHAAFCNDNEIAYIATVDHISFAAFANCLACRMMDVYGAICFESDDCDPAAMVLYNLFEHSQIESFDTYIYSV